MEGGVDQRFVWFVRKGVVAINAIRGRVSSSRAIIIVDNPTQNVSAFDIAGCSSRHRRVWYLLVEPLMWSRRVEILLIFAQDVG